LAEIKVLISQTSVGWGESSRWRRVNFWRRDRRLFEASYFVFKMSNSGQAWWRIPVIPALRRLRQENREFEASLGNLEPVSKKKRKKKRNFAFYSYGIVLLALMKRLKATRYITIHQ
jgi:uncharacterized membrane protein